MRVVRTETQERVDLVQNKLAAVIANAELALELGGGESGERLQRLLVAAYQASTLVASLAPQRQPRRSRHLSTPSCRLTSVANHASTATMHRVLA